MGDLLETSCTVNIFLELSYFILCDLKFIYFISYLYIYYMYKDIYKKIYFMYILYMLHKLSLISNNVLSFS